MGRGGTGRNERVRGEERTDVLDGAHVIGEESDVCEEITCAYPLNPSIENA